MMSTEKKVSSTWVVRVDEPLDPEPVRVKVDRIHAHSDGSAGNRVMLVDGSRAQHKRLFDRTFRGGAIVYIHRRLLSAKYR